MSNLATINYFELYDLDETFDINPGDIEEPHKQLQQQYHPDKFIGSDDATRLKALQMTSVINEAYQVLLSPLKRAGYLLSLNGVDPEENNQAHLGEEFLIRHMQLREQLEHIADTEAELELDKLKADVNEERLELIAALQKSFDKQKYKEAKPYYNRLQFAEKLLEEIDKIEEELLGY